MKKHLSVIIVVVLLLTGAYVFGHPETAKAPTPVPAEQFSKTQYSLTDPGSPWIIVNKQRPLNPIDYAPTDLVAVGNGQQLRADAGAELAAMLKAASSQNILLIPESGYRSYATQTTAYNSEVTAYGNAIADKESARPGYSEHQTGWAIDLGSNGCSVQDCFGSTPEGKWAIANSYRYGFILRYPADKLSVTGYRNEAWHFRYVGKPLAIELHRKQVETLEEFFNLPAAPDYK